MFVYTGNALEIESTSYNGHVWFGENNSADGSVSPLLDGSVLLVSCSENGDVKNGYGPLQFEYLSPIKGESSDSSSTEPSDVVTKSFVAAPGIYVAGNDFPSGVYEISCAEGTSLINIRVEDEEGHSVISGGFWANKDEKLGKIDILVGYTVVIQDGEARFAPSRGGITFD